MNSSLSANKPGVKAVWKIEDVAQSNSVQEGPSKRIKVIVQGLKSNSTEQSLRFYFQSFGAIKNVAIVKDSSSPRSCTSGFVIFEKSKAVTKVRAMSHHIIDGKKVRVRIATSSSSPSDNGDTSNSRHTCSSCAGLKCDRPEKKCEYPTQPKNSIASTEKPSFESSIVESSRSKPKLVNILLEGNGSTSNFIGKNKGKSKFRAKKTASSDKSMDFTPIVTDSIRNGTSVHVRHNGDKAFLRQDWDFHNSRKKRFGVQKKHSSHHAVHSGNGKGIGKLNESLIGNDGIVLNKIFVGGLNHTTDANALKRNFKKFGPVERAEVIYDHDTGRTRGFGFVVFEDSQSVSEALRNRNQSNYVVDGKLVEVKPCVARQACANGGVLAPQVKKSTDSQKKTLRPRKENEATDIGRDISLSAVSPTPSSGDSKPVSELVTTKSGSVVESSSYSDSETSLIRTMCAPDTMKSEAVFDSFFLPQAGLNLRDEKYKEEGQIMGTAQIAHNLSPTRSEGDDDYVCSKDSDFGSGPLPVASVSVPTGTTSHDKKLIETVERLGNHTDLFQSRNRHSRPAGSVWNPPSPSSFFVYEGLNDFRNLDSNDFQFDTCENKADIPVPCSTQERTYSETKLQPDDCPQLNEIRNIWSRSVSEEEFDEAPFSKETAEMFKPVFSKSDILICPPPREVKLSENEIVDHSSGALFCRDSFDLFGSERSLSIPDIPPKPKHDDERIPSSWLEMPAEAELEMPRYSWYPVPTGRGYSSAREPKSQTS